MELVRGLSENPNSAVLRVHEDSTVVIIPREVYIRKLESMIEEGITQGKYETTTDSTLLDLSSLQDFLYQNFTKFFPNLGLHPHYNHFYHIKNTVPKFLVPGKFSCRHAQFNYNQERPRDFGGE